MSARETQQRILDAAERLFARNGFAATSLRNVTGEAGVNLAAVHYHFGSKEALVAAVFARRLRPLNDERLGLLAAAEEEARQAGEPAPTVERILSALVVPTASLAAREAGELSLLAGLLGRVNDESCADLVRSLHGQFEAVTSRFLEALAGSLPDLAQDELYMRFHFVIGTVASSLGAPRRLELLSGGSVDTHDLGALADSLVTFLAAALRAPHCAPPPAPDPQATEDHPLEGAR